jgi:hypothetical protein
MKTPRRSDLDTTPREGACVDEVSIHLKKKEFKKLKELLRNPTLQCDPQCDPAMQLRCDPAVRSCSAILRRSLSAILQCDFQCDPRAIIFTDRWKFPEAGALSSTTLHKDQGRRAHSNHPRRRHRHEPNQRPGSSNSMQNYHSTNHHNPRWSEPLRQVDEQVLENMCSTDAPHYRTWEGIDPGNLARCRTQNQPGQRPQHLEHEDLERAESSRVGSARATYNVTCPLLSRPSIHHACISASTTNFIELFILVQRFLIHTPLELSDHPSKVTLRLQHQRSSYHHSKSPNLMAVDPQPVSRSQPRYRQQAATNSASSIQYLHNWPWTSSHQHGSSCNTLDLSPSAPDVPNNSTVE